MTKVRNFVEITPNLPFSEFNFYELYRETFEKSALGRMKKLLPLHELAESLGLVSKSMVQTQRHLTRIHGGIYKWFSFSVSVFIYRQTWIP